MMSIKETLDMNELLDMYESLLTKKQSDVMSSYYQEDLSLAEIAENMDISRSGVSDHIKRTEKLLHEYEEKLQLVKKHKKRIQIYDKIKALNEPKLEKLIESLESCE